jgi:L-lysine exporter family protein LysE/ArgO
MFTLTYTPAMFSAWASGTATGLGLFAVVGAQSAFILRQGLMRAHLLSILAICALLDGICIFASVWGLQAVVGWFPWLTHAVLWFGVLFLTWYAIQSARRAIRAEGGLVAAKQAMPSRSAALVAAAGFTLLNPHFWLDIMVLGSLAHGFDEARLAFAAGAVTASVLWLIVLGVGSRVFAPAFANPKAWRVLDGIIAVIMIVLAVRLAMNGLSA